MTNQVTSTIGDYAQLRTLPAALGLAYLLASLYQFGGIEDVHIQWVSYELTNFDAMLVSILSILVAFASSETLTFTRYERWEQIAIVAGPALIMTHQFLPTVEQFITANQPEAGIIGFAISAFSWAVMVRG